MWESVKFLRSDVVNREVVEMFADSSGGTGRLFIGRSFTYRVDSKQARVCSYLHQSGRPEAIHDQIVATQTLRRGIYYRFVHNLCVI